MSEKEMTCSFCGAKASEVDKLIAANEKVAICDECIMSSLDILVYGEELDTIELEVDEDITEENSSAQADSGC